LLAECNSNITSVLGRAHLKCIDPLLETVSDPQLVVDAAKAGRLILSTLVELQKPIHPDLKFKNETLVVLSLVRNILFVVGLLWCKHAQDIDLFSPLLLTALRIVRLANPLVHFHRSSVSTSERPLLRLFESFQKSAFEYFRASPSALPTHRLELAGLCF
jgi:hypothetical protein